MITKNEQETKEFAKEFLKGITSPKVIALEGELGAGKTTFIQGLAKSLGIEKRVLSLLLFFCGVTI